MTSPADLLSLLRRFEVIDPATTPPPGIAQSAEAAGAAWVALGLLTQFQLDALLRGKGDRLRVGPYLLLERLGKGGMGEVFRSRHVRLGREVALKLIRPDKLESPTAAARFLRELRATARVDHPNVVRVLNAGKDARQFYFSMEYVRGVNLADLVKAGGTLAVADACRAVADAAQGLAAVHAAGLIHRDVKPANLIREAASGRTKVLDLGLAGLTARAFDDSAAKTLTHAGMLLGTPDYIAPEQALNPHAADARSDLYSLGCTLFHLLAGSPPFAGGTPVERLFRHAYAPAPDVRQGRPEVPPAVAELVARLLAKSPADRPSSAAAVADGLAGIASPGTAADTRQSYIGEEYVTVEEPFAFVDPDEDDAARARPAGRPALPPTAARARHRWWPYAAGGVAAAGVALVVALLLLPADPVPLAPPAVAPEQAAAALRDAMTRPGADTPKLRAELYDLYAEHRGGPSSVAIARVLRRTPSPLDDLPAVDNTTKLALVARWNVSGPRHWGPAFAVAVAPDGKTVATAGQDRVVRLWEADTARPVRTLAGFSDPVYEVTFSPDVRRVAAASRLRSPDDTEGFERTARIWDVATGEQVLTVGAPLDWVVSWRYHPDGTSGLAGRYDELKLRSAKDGKVLKVFVGKSQGTNWVTHAAFSRDGKHAIAACNNHHVHVWDVESAAEVRAWKAADWFVEGMDLSPAEDVMLTVATGEVRVWDWTSGKRLAAYKFDPPPMRAAFTPDGKRILVGCSDGRLGLIDRDTGRWGELTGGHDGEVLGVAVAPDGKRAFTVGRDGILRRWVVTGPTPTEIDPVTTARPAAALAFTDEDRSLVVARPGHPPQVWKLAGQPPTPPGVVGGAGAVAASPDGMRVVTADRGRLRVWSAADATSKEFEGPGDGPSAVTWLADSKRVVLAYKDAKADLAVVDASSGRTTTRLVTHGEPVDGVLAASADGRWLAAGLANGGVGWWDLGAGKPAGVAPRPLAAGGVSGVVFPPGQQTPRVFGSGWSLHELPPGGQRAGKPMWDGDSGVPLVAAVSPDRAYTAVATRAGVLHLLTEGGRSVHVLPLPGRATALTFSTNGRYLAAAQADGGVSVYRLP